MANDSDSHTLERQAIGGISAGRSARSWLSKGPETSRTSRKIKNAGEVEVRPHRRLAMFRVVFGLVNDGIVRAADADG